MSGYNRIKFEDYEGDEKEDILYVGKNLLKYAYTYQNIYDTRKGWFMGKANKLVEKWKKIKPVEVHIKDVKNVLNSYFYDQWFWEGSSHIVVRNSNLKNYRDYQPYGEFSVPVKHGKRVKGIYIRKMLKAISLLEIEGYYEV